jgi:hypothetical protein
MLTISRLRNRRETKQIGQSQSISVKKIPGPGPGGKFPLNQKSFSTREKGVFLKALRRLLRWRRSSLFRRSPAAKA